MSFSLNNSGAPVCIIKISKDGEFELNSVALSEILLNESIKNKFVVVISIAGDYRKGKSFLLNFGLRYLQSGCRADWLDDLGTPLNGFSWKMGDDVVTTGILMWSQPFFVQQNDGTEVAILLMDTQGIFDTEHPTEVSTKIFSISTLISSIQIYNQFRNLQENDLQFLDSFLEYSQLIIDRTEDCRKPFQKLLYLIRDYPNPHLNTFGFVGGKSFLDKRLKIERDRKSELTKLRLRLNSYFKGKDCFLMPHPGKIVESDPSFTGQISDIDSDFKEYMKLFWSGILDPSYIVMKEIGGQLVTAKDLFDYIQVYIKEYSNKTLPEPTCLYNAMAELNNLKAAEKFSDVYCKHMQEFCREKKGYVQPKKLESEHEEIKDRVVEMFDKTPRFGGIDYGPDNRERLIKKVEEQYKWLQEQNDKEKKPSLQKTVKYVSSVFGFAVGCTAVVLIYILGR